MSEQDKQSGKGKKNGAGDDNVTPFPSSMRDRQQYYKEKQLKEQPPPPKQPYEPMLNLPPAVKILSLVLIGIHAASLLLSADMKFKIYYALAFVPARYTGDMPFDIWAFIAPVTHMFLHVGWTHLFVNTGMTLVFGTMLERLRGVKHMMMIFIAAGLVGAFTHMAFYPFSPAPLIGASGGLSGLFGAVIIIMGNQPGASRKSMYWMIGIWVLISLVFGGIGFGSVDNVAWTAHIGGLFGGIGMFAYLRKKYYKYKE